MFALYSAPYFFASLALGPLGGALMLVILFMGILRCSFLLVLFLARDWKRLESERLEGWQCVKDKFWNLRQLLRKTWA